jgi:hypothetical protein
MTKKMSFDVHGSITKVAVTALLIAAPMTAVSIPAYATPGIGAVLPAAPPSPNPSPNPPAPGRAPLNFGGPQQQPAGDWNGYGQGDGGGGGGGGGG